MLNMFTLLGRLTKDVELQEIEGKKVATITIATNRSFKNEEGIFETDFFNITLWANIAENTCEYCHKGDLIAIKGRLQTRIIEKEDGTKENKIELIAEKISFLSSKKEQQDGQNESNK